MRNSGRVKVKQTCKSGPDVRGLILGGIDGERAEKTTFDRVGHCDSSEEQATGKGQRTGGLARESSDEMYGL